MLSTRTTPTREVVGLDGLWRFALDTTAGADPWKARLDTVLEAPVPASYNDLFVDSAIRDHVGVVWDQRDARVPRGWQGERIVLRFGSVTHAAQVYVNDDKNLDTDVQFGVTRALVGNYVRHESGNPPAADVSGPWYSLDFTFTVEPGVSKLPRAPITAKAEGERVKLEILERK